MSAGPLRSYDLRAECSSSALRLFAKLGLDLVAGLQLLKRVPVGLELVRRALGVANGDLAGVLIDLHDLAFDLLRGLRALHAFFLGLPERQSRRQQRARRERTGSQQPTFHRRLLAASPSGCV